MTTEQFATIPQTKAETVSNGYNYGRDKELTQHFLLIHDNKAAVDLRIYYARSKYASTCYASVWLHWGKLWTSGKGRAGGYGYHRASAAAAQAFQTANVKLSKDINGRGDNAIEEALYAIGHAMGFERSAMNVLSF
jgi:hypothetical protein